MTEKYHDGPGPSPIENTNLSADTIDFGSTPLLSRPRLVLALAAILVITAVLVAALRAHDRHHTLTQEQFVDAVTTFQPDIKSSDVTLRGPTELADDVIATDPAPCHVIVDLGPSGALAAASWYPAEESGEGANLQAWRFHDPATARKVFAAVRDAAQDCPQATFLASEDDEGGRFTVSDVYSDKGPWPRRLHYTVRVVEDGTEPEEPNSVEFSVDAVRYGNVVAWAVDVADDHPDAQHPTEQLVSRMRTVTR